jgi:putative endonuclease
MKLDSNIRWNDKFFQGSSQRRLGSRVMKQYCVYILASRRNGTLYIGVTNDLKRRVSEHKGKLVDGFTKQYDIGRLVHFEPYDDIRDAILREKRLKAWKRAWKVRLIEESNPDWDDLTGTLR